MAYVLNHAIVHNFANDEWVTLNLDADLTALQTATIQSLIDTYSGVVLSLTNPIASNTVYFDLAHNADIIADKTRTLQQWLTYLGDAPIPVVNQPPQIKLRYVEYSHAAKAGWRWRMAARDSNPDAIVADSEKVDLILYRENTSYNLAAKRCLVSVNGLLHRCVAESYGLRVLDGASAGYALGSIEIGIYDFSSFGDIEIIPIRKIDISQFDTNTPLRERFVVNLNRDLKRKTVMLSLGGYLHALDGSVYDQRNRTVVVKTRAYQLAQRLFDSVSRIHIGNAVDALEFDENWRIRVGTLHSDDFIATYFSNSQSFAIVINNPRLYKELELVKDISFTGNYETTTKPKYPLVTTLGRFCEYWPDRKGTWWQISGFDPFYRNYKFYNQDWEDKTYVEGSLDPSQPYLPCNNCLLKLYTQVVSLV